MKQTLLLILFSFFVSAFMTACTGQLADKMAVVGNQTLSSDPCAAIDEKMMRLDRFTEVVKNTSAFHLEEKSAAIPTPGITVSNNRKQMLKEADKKYAEYSAERQKYGCETPMNSAQTADKMAIVDPCAAIDEKVMRLDRFTEVVKNTSAFHLEEKSAAIPTPGITVSNNRKQMLKDADKKYAEYSAERQKYGCETPMNSAQTADKMAVVSKPTLSSDPSVIIDKEPIKSDESTTKVNNIPDVHVEEKAAVLPVPVIAVSNNKEQILRDVEKKDEEHSAERQKYGAETLMSAGTDKVAATDSPSLSSEVCDKIDKKLIQLYEFMIIINNTSAFHLEEKARALPSPGFTVSNNKKKMLRDAEKKRVELLAEREKYGCETAEK